MRKKMLKTLSGIALCTFLFSNIFCGFAFSLENNSDDFNREISKYTKNQEYSIEPLGLEPGESRNLLKYVNDGNLQTDKKLLWLTSDSNIVSVNENGDIDAISDGVAKIYGIDVENKINYAFDVIVQNYDEGKLINAPYGGRNFDESGKYKVFIDPGHGGSDSGAVGPTGYYEKDMTLDVGLRLREKLKAKGVIVEMSRETDWRYSDNIVEDLNYRSDKANEFGADAFVSIHNNSASPQAHGTETYIHDSYGPRIDESRKLAQYAQNRLVRYLGSNDRGIKTADFSVVRRTKMPAILAELDFISNSWIEHKMQTPEYRDNCAAALADGVMEYLKTITPSAPIEPEVPVTDIFVNKNESYLISGDATIVEATVLPRDASNKNVIWTSDDTTVAVVDNNGKITARKEGTAVITAKTADGELEAQTKVYVKNQVPAERIFGIDRYETSYEIASRGWRNSDYAIIANGADYPDALCAVPLAKKYNAPILLSESNVVREGLKDQLQALNVKKVFIIGGTGVISNNIERSIKSLNIETERLGGNTRYETSVMVAEKVGTNGEIAIVTGNNYPDALSMAPVAGTLNMPIVLSRADNLSYDIENFIDSHNINRTYIIGGEALISYEIEESVPNAKRIFGNDRYETNRLIIDEFAGNLNLLTPYIAVGNNFPDALAGGALAAKNENPIVLADPTGCNLNVKKAIIKNIWNMENAYVLGSNALISDEYLRLNLVSVR